MSNISARAKKLYPTIAVFFCSLLLLSNILAVKPIQIGDLGATVNLGNLQLWPLILDGGAILFPLTYILGDVISEIYGFKSARKVILTGFFIEVVAVFAIFIVRLLPSASGWGNDDAFLTILGFVPRIVLASLSGYLVGELLNSFVLVKIKSRTKNSKLWIRLIGSTLVGEAADTLTFCTIAFLGVITLPQFLNYTLIGYIFKCLLEIILLPITYRIVAYLKDDEYK
ncbi:MAG: queuosine precursor transporter [Candidatus Ancillula sp.]|nr:queuosine precursor transporter [Candidatus Ancillula sp.]